MHELGDPAWWDKGCKHPSGVPSPDYQITSRGLFTPEKWL